MTKILNELNDADLEKVVGGRGGGIFNASDISGADRKKPWEVIDKHGDVVTRCASRDEAIFEAGRKDQGYKELSWENVQHMRG